MRGIQRFLCRWTVGALVVVLAGCSSSSEGGSSIQATTTAPEDTSDQLVVILHNDQLDAIRAWLLVEGQRVRLGQVNSNSSETFYYKIPGVRQVRLEFDISLGRRCVTVDRPLGPGENITVRIPSQLTGFPGVCR